MLFQQPDENKTHICSCSPVQNTIVPKDFELGYLLVMLVVT